MEDNETIAAKNAEADDMLIEWSVKMARECWDDFREFAASDLYSWLLWEFSDIAHSYSCGRGVRGADHVMELVKNNGTDYENVEYAQDVAQTIDACSREHENRRELVLYGLTLYVLRFMKYRWDVKDFEQLSGIWKRVSDNLWQRLCPILIAFMRGLMQGKNVLAEWKDFPVEVIVEQMKSELPDDVLKSFEQSVN